MGSARLVYEGNPPYNIDIHTYNNAGDTLVAAANGLGSANYGATGLIIGEAFYNDSTSAMQLAAAIQQISRPVHYVIQWPLTRVSPCEHVNVAPPILFDNYINQGF